MLALEAVDAIDPMHGRLSGYGSHREGRDRGTEGVLLGHGDVADGRFCFGTRGRLEPPLLPLLRREPLVGATKTRGAR